MNLHKDKGNDLVTIQSNLRSFCINEGSKSNLEFNHVLKYKSIKIDIQRIPRSIDKVKNIKNYLELKR